ncbi:MAG: hypothetical protein ABJF23_18960 [Bryobacteraceae bacterium]
MRWLPEMLLMAGLLSAQPGITPRPKAEDFPAHQETATMAIGAEFMVHSFGRDAETYVNEEYLTFEVGIYPVKRKPVLISAGQFTLRINGKKDVIHPERASQVASSLQYADWERRAQRDGADGPGTINAPSQSGPRFPGDNGPSRGRLPQPPQLPADSTLTPPEHIAPSVLLKEVALVEGEHKFPTGGYLYFPYHGKIKSIRSLELIYTSEAESTTLRLR